MAAKRYAVVLSDIHIGNGTPTCWYQTSAHEDYLTAALRWVAGNDQVGEVVLLGDVFDTWTYPPSMPPPTMKDIIRANPRLLGPSGPFAALVRALPGRVRIMLGNHDLSLNRGDIDVLNASLGGNVARGEAITLVDCPVLVIRAPGPKGAATAFTHGHHWCMFNAPDAQSPWSRLPAGYFVTRAIAYKWSRELAVGRTVADLSGMCNPDGKGAWMTAVAALIDRRAEKGPIRDKLVSILLDYICEATGMPSTEPILLPNGRSTTVDAAKAAFSDLWRRWAATKEGREVDADRAAVADWKGSFLAWFAQRLAFQTSSDLVVMGHTHVAVRGLKISPVSYVNSGYFCVSKPDMRTTPVTFTVVDIPNASAQLVKVVEGARGPEVENLASGEAPLLPVIPSIGEDYSCYLRVRNHTGGPLSLAGISKRAGYWTVLPPKSIADGARVDIWLQDELGTDGAQGAFTYTDAISAKALAFGFRCPTPHKGRNAVTSPVPNWETKVSDGGWRERDTAWLGHPLQVRFDVGAPTPTGTNGGLPGTAVTALATRPRSDCHEPPDPERTPVGHQQQAAEHADYIAIGARILAKCKISAGRGKVISHAYLRSSTRAPLIDTRTEPGAVPRRVRLSNPPKYVMSGEVFEIYDETYGPFRYILIQPNGPAPPPAIGGFLFLPSEGSRNLHLVTFNVAKLDVSYKSQCRHDHHAEMQVVRWAGEQPPDWRARIGWLTIQNGSRKRDLAYSPCNACCHELASFLTSVKSLPRRSSDVLARLSWGDIYEGAAKCGHPTTMSGIDMLKKAGWELPEHPMPPGVSMVGSGIATADDPRWPARVLSTR